MTAAMSEQPDHSDLLPPHLRVVANENVSHISHRVAPPAQGVFDEYAVADTSAKITSVGALDIDGAVFNIGEMVKIVIEARVIGVDHELDKTERHLIRKHKLTALDVVVVDWNIDLGELRDGR